MKEMARQAKAMREDRRAGLDTRHKWIISKVYQVDHLTQLLKQKLVSIVIVADRIIILLAKPFLFRPEGSNSASGAGGMVAFKSRADQISHTLLTTRHRCNLDVWTQAQSRGVWHRSLVTPGKGIKRV